MKQQNSNQVKTLCDLAHDLTCAGGFLVRMDHVLTPAGDVACVSAHCRAVPGELRVVPCTDHLEVWWQRPAVSTTIEYVGDAAGTEDVLRLARGLRAQLAA